MTDPSHADSGLGDPPEADSPLSDEARARVEALQRRRAANEERATRVGPAHSSPDRTARKRPATATKIAAVGIGGVTMFGLVAAMGLANGASPGAAAPAQPTRPVVVVIHQPDGGSDKAATADLAVGNVAAPRGTDASAPIELRAQPVVTAVEVQVDQPQVSTNGSR